MKQVMTFSDWTSLSQLQNQINPDLKVKSVVILKGNDSRSCSLCDCSQSDINNSQIAGYEIVVYQRHNPSNIIYRVRVEADDKPGDWSLSFDQAVEMLNSLGFYCEYVAPPYVITSEMKECLTSLVGLGFTHIRRYFTNGVGSVWSYDIPNGCKDPFNLEFSENYNYIDWVFLPVGRNILISGLLDNKSLEDIES